MKLSVFTPEKKLVTDQEIEDVLVPGHNGEIHILSGHSPLITKLSTGVLRWRLKGQTEYNRVVISSGYCEVNPEEVLVLAEYATLPQEVVSDKFKTEAAALEKKLGQEFLDDESWDETQRRLAELKSGLELGNQKH
ncbi:MAG: ATP synthase F1 subunit epsilon [Bdellovibrionales bacterium]